VTVAGETLLGIDFGTTHTVAVVGDTPLLFDASPLLASAVAAAADGTLLTGRDAQRSALQDPGRFEPNPKLRIDEGRVLLGGAELTVEELIAAPLRRVAAEAGRVLGAPPARTVLTHPASWAAGRRDVLLRAAQRAGLSGVTLVPEPVAAAVHHTRQAGGPGGTVPPPGAIIAVYDLGGGTFDLTLLRNAGPGWPVVATTGLEDVGGIDLDAALVEHLGRSVGAREPRRWRRLVEPVDPAGRRVLQAFRDDVRGAKEQLSRATSAVVRVPGFEIDAYLSREEFESVAQPLLVRTVDVLAALLARAGVARLDGLYLVGGSSRIPLVATLLHRRFGVAPTLVEQPELVVALGSVHVPALPIPINPENSIGTAGATAPAPFATAAGAPSPSSSYAAAAPPTALGNTAGVPPTASGSPAGAPPAGPGGPAGVPASASSPGRRRAGPIAVGVAVLVVLAVLAVWQNGQDKTGGQTDDRTTGTAGNAAGAGGAAPRAVKQTVNLDKTAWYAGFEIKFLNATYDPAAGDPLQVALKVTNRGSEDQDLLHITVPMTVRFAGKSYGGNYTESQKVGAKGDVDAVMAFPVTDPVNLPDGVLSVGDNDRLTATVPFLPGSAVTTVAPVQILAPTQVVTDGLTFKVSCELRGDLINAHEQVRSTERAIGCSFDVSYSGTRYAGVNNNGLRLVMPDGNVRAPAKYPAFHLNNGDEQRDQSVEFTFAWPVTGSGPFALRLFDPDLAKPDREDVTLTLPKA
jgi:hypothetical protein